MRMKIMVIIKNMKKIMRKYDRKNNAFIFLKDSFLIYNLYIYYLIKFYIHNFKSFISFIILF